MRGNTGHLGLLHRVEVSPRRLVSVYLYRWIVWRGPRPGSWRVNFYYSLSVKMPAF